MFPEYFISGLPDLKIRRYPDLEIVPEGKEFLSCHFGISLSEIWCVVVIKRIIYP